MKRIYLSALACVMLLASIAMTPMHVSATGSDIMVAISDTIEEEGNLIEITPFFSNLQSMWTSMSFNNSGRATMSIAVFGHPGAAGIVLTARLDRVNANGTLTRMADFGPFHSPTDMLIWTRDHFVARGHYYRLTSTTTVTRNGTNETVSNFVTAWAH